MRSLITGGTGTLGQAVAKRLQDVKIFSRHAVDQEEMKRHYPNYKYIIGCIRDYDAIYEAMENVDIVYHFAAIKHINICEQQPMEALKTNVIGTMQVIKACKDRKVKKIVFISTDKAENPTSFYGLTKAMGENLIINSGLGYHIVRSGNIFGSSGSVVPLFIKQINDYNCITLTKGDMTRFFILPDDLAKCLIEGTSPAYITIRIGDLAECIAKVYGDDFTDIKEIGSRPGEKLHETLNGVSSEKRNISKDKIHKLLDQWKRSQ